MLLLLLLLLSLHADLASLPHPLLEEKKVAQQVVEHVLQGIFHFSHSALSSLSLIFILRPGGSFIGIMFPRRSLFRFLFAAVNTHVVAKNMLVCVLYGYNDRLKRFLSFSVREALRLAAVISKRQSFLTV